MNTVTILLISPVRTPSAPRPNLAVSMPDSSWRSSANPQIERFMRTGRQEAPDSFIFLSTNQIRRVALGYIRYYNGARPSHAMHATPDPYPEQEQPRPQDGWIVALPVLGNVQHDQRLVAYSLSSRLLPTFWGRDSYVLSSEIVT